MKKFLILLLLSTIVGNAQIDVTSVLNAQLPGEPGELFLGCCNEDGLSPEGTNEDLCTFKEYVAYGDVFLHRSRFVLRNCTLTIIDGNFITNGLEVEYTCGAELIFERGGRLVMFEEDLNTLSIDLKPQPDSWPIQEPFQVYDVTGRLVYRGKNNAKGFIESLKNKSLNQVFILKIKGYSPLKIIK